MDNEYFTDRVKEMKPEWVGNSFFRAVSEKYGVAYAGELISLFDEIYPGSREGRRRINVPLKSTFIQKANQKLIDGN